MPGPTALWSHAVAAHTSSGGGSGHLLEVHIYSGAIPGLAEAHIPAEGGSTHVQQAWVILALWHLGMLCLQTRDGGRETEAGAWGRLCGPPNLKGGRTESGREPKKEGGGTSNQLASLGAMAHPNNPSLHLDAPPHLPYGSKEEQNSSVSTDSANPCGQVALQDLSLTQTVVGRVMAPKDVHVPTPRIWNLLP